MKNFLFLILLFFFQTSRAQNINWFNSSNWKLFDIHDEASLQFRLDTLSNFNYIELKKDSIDYYLKEMDTLPKTKVVLWMGAFIATCKMKDELHKIDISVYGGFIYDEFEKRYYQLPPALRNPWLDYLNRSIDNMPDKK